MQHRILFFFLAVGVASSTVTYSSFANTPSQPDQTRVPPPAPPRNKSKIPGSLENPIDVSPKAQLSCTHTTSAAKIFYTLSQPLKDPSIAVFTILSIPHNAPPATTPNGLLKNDYQSENLQCNLALAPPNLPHQLRCVDQTTDTVVEVKKTDAGVQLTLIDFKRRTQQFTFSQAHCTLSATPGGGL